MTVEAAHFVGISYSEFQSLYFNGGITLHAGRLAKVRLGPDGQPAPDCVGVDTLLGRLPQLPLDDEEGVILLELCDPTSSSALRTSPSDPTSVVIPVGAVHRLLGLSKRATRLLESRLQDMGVRIGQPVFNGKARLHWFRRGAERALAGGDSLLATLVVDGDAAINESLRASATRAIWDVDHEDDEADGLSCPVVVPRSCISGIFQYTRHDASAQGDYEYLNDLGHVLRRKMSADHVIEGDGGYRQLCIRLKSELGADAGLHDILSSELLRRFDIKVQADFADLFPARLAAIVLFLRWKQLFQNPDLTIDINRLAAEAARFAGSAGFDAIAQAVWLLGCYAGHERVAHLRYAANPDAYPWYGGPKLDIVRCSRSAPDNDIAAAPEPDAICTATNDTAGTDAVAPADPAVPATNDASPADTPEEPGQERADAEGAVSAENRCAESVAAPAAPGTDTSGSADLFSESTRADSDPAPEQAASASLEQSGATTGSRDGPAGGSNDESVPHTGAGRKQAGPVRSDPKRTSTRRKKGAKDGS